MPSKIMIDSDFMQLSMGELERCKDEDDQVFCTYKKMIGISDETDSESKAKIGVIKFLLATNNLNRLYFLIRSSLMALISGIIFLIAIVLLGTVNAPQAIAIGIFIYIVSLFISRFVDKPINKVTNLIIRYLDRHKKIKQAILDNI